MSNIIVYDILYECYGYNLAGISWQDHVGTNPFLEQVCPRCRKPNIVTQFYRMLWIQGVFTRELYVISFLEAYIRSSLLELPFRDAAKTLPTLLCAARQLLIRMAWRSGFITTFSGVNVQSVRMTRCFRCLNPKGPFSYDISNMYNHNVFMDFEPLNQCKVILSASFHLSNMRFCK